jgi:hypothetical protein
VGESAHLASCSRLSNSCATLQGTTANHPGCRVQTLSRGNANEGEIREGVGTRGEFPSPEGMSPDTGGSVELQN